MTDADDPAAASTTSDPQTTIDPEPTAQPDPTPVAAAKPDPAATPESGSAPLGAVDLKEEPEPEPEPGTGPEPETGPQSVGDPEPGAQAGPGSDASAVDRGEPSTDQDMDLDMDAILALVAEIEARARLKPDVELERVDAAEPGLELAATVEPDEEPDPDPEPALELELELQDELEPAAHRLRAADPADQRRRDVAPAGQVLAVMVATLLLAAGLNSDAMLRSAEASPLGPGRDLAVGFWRPVYGVSSRIGLTGPRDGLDALRRLGSGEGDPAGGDGTELVAGLPSAPAGPSADQDTVDATDPTPGRGDSLGGATPGTGLLGLDPAGLGGGTADSTANGARSGPLAGEAPQGPPSPVAPTTTSATAPTTQPAPGPTATPATPPPPDDVLRRPTPADPLRILLVGDSTMDAVGAAVLRELEPTGVTRAAVDYKVSSGLARPDFFDWPAHLREARTATRFELVVIMMGANDAQPFMIDGRAENFGTERWLTTYRQRVAALLQQLTADGGSVLWIGQPVMRKETFDADMQQIDRIYAEEVARVPRARYLDSRAILSDEKGAYATHLVDAAGDRQRVRQDDGIHLTEAGAERLAPAVVDAINTLAPLY